jgi:hypothetical protein
LSERGALIAHPVVAAISARLLRPGTSPESDEALLALRTLWASEEERLGIDIPLRSFAAATAASESGPAARYTRSTMGEAMGEEASGRYALLVNVLWPRGEDVRGRALPAPNFYADNPPTDRRLLLAALPPASAPVDVSSENWRRQADDALVRQGETHLRAPRGEAREVRRALLDFAVRPSEVGYLHLYPTLFGLAMSADEVQAALFVRELEI